MLGRIKCFKNFLETAVKDKLEAMLMQKPNYFYDILSYTLEEGKTLANYNIGKEATIHLSIKLTFYKINVIESKYGTIEPNNARENEKINLTITPKENYQIKNINVYKINNKDEHIIIENNTFTMPEFDVTVEVEFEEIITNNITNPKIGDNIYIIFLINMISLYCLSFLKKYLSSLKTIK